ncbi:MAG: CPBP family intramembrane metalloprotease [Lachnospiraceae bacterium]|nr:CPBP family intramembrane metalloprotease [Lachnospiraceae bacterium]
MTNKRVGWAFMWMIFAFLAASTVCSLFFSDMHIMILALLSESCLLIPACICLFKGRAGYGKQLHLKGVSKASTILLSLVYLFCGYPLVIALNAFTMVITGNEAQGITDQFDGIPLFLVWFTVGFMGPVVEEIVFRGIILGGLRTTGRIFSAIVLSGFLFGLMHLNLNQFSYTVVMGIFWGLLVEASGSILTSMFCHITMNSLSVFLTFLIGDKLDEVNGILSGPETEFAAAELLATGMVFIVIGIGATALAMLLLRVIALNEGQTGCFENIFRKKSKAEKYGSLFSIPLIIGMAVAAAVIVVDVVFGLFY